MSLGEIGVFGFFYFISLLLFGGEKGVEGHVSFRFLLEFLFNPFQFYCLFLFYISCFLRISSLIVCFFLLARYHSFLVFVLAGLEWGKPVYSEDSMAYQWCYCF